MPPARHTQRSGPATAVLLLTLALIAAACDQWSGVGYGPARTSWNAAETELGPTEVDELWVTCSPEVYLLFAEDAGWTDEQYEHWAATTLARLLPRT